MGTTLAKSATYAFDNEIFGRTKSGTIGTDSIPPEGRGAEVGAEDRIVVPGTPIPIIDWLIVAFSNDRPIKGIFPPLQEDGLV